MTDVVAAIEARLDEIEAVARGVASGPWEWEAEDGLNDPAAVLRMVAGLRAIVALAGETAPPMWDGDCYEGRVGGSEHRTAGCRAWCFQCSEWCYPESYACPCCEPPVDPDDLREALAAMFPATPAAASEGGAEL